MNTFPDNDDFDKGLRNLAGNAETELPEGSWERLKLKQAEKSNSKKIKYIIFFSSVLFLLIASSFFLYNYYYNLPAIEKTSLNNAPVKQTVSDNSSAISNTPKQNEEKANSSEKKNAGIVNSTANKTEKTFVSPEKSKVTENFKKEEQNIQKTENTISDENNKSEQAAQNTAQLNETPVKHGDSTIITVNRDSVKANILSLTDSTNTDLSEELHDRKYAKNEFHITAVYNYNIAWIMNQNTYGQFNGKELAYKMDYGSAYGILAGYDVARKYGFQAGIIFNSQQGQKYHDSFTFGEFTREINLRYMHIPFAFKLKRYLNDSKNPIILNFVIGGQYGKLKSAEEILNGQTTDIKERFKKSELSLILNIESDFYINNSLYITFGLNSSFSNNINAKDWPVNDDYGKSHNMLTGLVFGLNYYIPVY